MIDVCEKYKNSNSDIFVFGGTSNKPIGKIYFKENELVSSGKIDKSFASLIKEINKILKKNATKSV